MRKYLIGIGLVLIVVHNPNQPFINYVFLPWVGIMLLVGAIVSVPFKIYKKHGLGSKWVWIPLLILSLSIAASGVAQYMRGEITWQRGLAPLCATLIWFGVYLLARIDGEKIGRPIAIAVIIEAASVVFMAVSSGGVRNGGFVSPTNYDIATAFLVFGTFMAPKSWQWWLSGIAIVGLFFTGAEEGIVAMGAAALVLLLVKDFSVKTLFPVTTLALALLVATPLGITHNLYLQDNDVAISNVPVALSTVDKIQAAELAVQNLGEPEFPMYMDIATGYRWSTHWRIRPIQPFGYGYNITEFYPGIPHNIVLIIIEQVGLVGMAAWITVTAYCIKTSKRWYLWASVLALGVFDHYLFTQSAPLIFALWGLSEAHPYVTANIYKGDMNEG